MTRSDAGLLGAAALAADYAEDLLLGTVKDVHGAVAGRVYGLLEKAKGGGPTLSHRVHDGVSGAVYGGLGGGLRLAARGLRAADERGLGPAVEATPQGRALVAAVNGLIGDRLRDERPELAVEMAVRLHGRDVPLTPEHLATAYPEAGESLVVFVHGLCETEEVWGRRRRPVDPDSPEPGSYGSRLARDEGWSPVWLRVNTGLPIAENGVALAGLLDRLIAAWPVGVRRLALVGHSMGGLIIRAAGAVTTDAESPWTDRVTDVVTLGAPHLGAPLERVVAKGTRVLGALPESAPFGRILEYRSVGILDLRNGLAADVRHLPHARYRLVAGSLSRSPRNPVALTVGDGLVQPRSAFGRPRSGPEMFPGASTLHVPGADHFDLLNHDSVYAALRRWLARAPGERGGEQTA